MRPDEPGRRVIEQDSSEPLMCLAPAHHLAGFATGAALAMHAHQPLWVALPSAAVASLTAGGRFSPDADQFRRVVARCA